MIGGALAPFSTLLVVLVLGCAVLLALLIGYPLALASGSARPLYLLARVGLGLARRLAGIRLVVDGRERLEDARNLLVVANHASHLDGPLLLLALGVDFAVLLKKELAPRPLRPLLRAAGFVPIDRGDRGDAARALEQAAAVLGAGRCLLFFPEGTRSRDGRLGELKLGAFAVALAAGSRVAPVAILGAHALMPRGSPWIRQGLVRVKILATIETRGLERDALAARVRSALAAGLEDEGERF